MIIEHLSEALSFKYHVLLFYKRYCTKTSVYWKLVFFFKFYFRFNIDYPLVIYTVGYSGITVCVTAKTREEGK